METSTTDKASVILLKKYEEGRAKNARWSQRAFAKRLGISSGALSEILQGKRPLTPQLKKRLAVKLGLSPLEELDFFEDMTPDHLRPNRLEYVQLTTDQFHLISDWWHFAMLNLIRTKGFKASTSWIAKRLGISQKISDDAWDRLFRLGHLKKTGGKVTREYPRIQTSDGIVNMSVRKAHIEDTRLIEKSIEEVHIDMRDHSSMTIVINKKDIKKAKEMIRVFQDKFVSELEVNPGDEVYRLSVSLFPLSKVAEE